MKRDVALYLLHDLVNVTIEYRHRPESLEVVERTSRIVRSPSPLRVDGPQRDVREDDDRSRCRAVPEVVLEPLELVIPKITQTAGLELDDINEPDEVDAISVEAVPTRAFGAATVPVPIKLHVLVENVVFTRDVMHIEPGL